jgi:hypothetical protein
MQMLISKPHNRKHKKLKKIYDGRCERGEDEDEDEDETETKKQKIKKML